MKQVWMVPKQLRMKLISLSEVVCLSDQTLLRCSHSNIKNLCRAQWILVIQSYKERSRKKFSTSKRCLNKSNLETSKIMMLLNKKWKKWWNVTRRHWLKQKGVLKRCYRMHWTSTNRSPVFSNLSLDCSAVKRNEIRCNSISDIWCYLFTATSI